MASGAKRPATGGGPGKQGRGQGTGGQGTGGQGKAGPGKGGPTATGPAATDPTDGSTDGSSADAADATSPGPGTTDEQTATTDEQAATTEELVVAGSDEPVTGATVDATGGIVEPPAGTTEVAAPSRKGRRRLVTLLAVLTCIGFLTSAVAVWSHRTLLNTDAWMEVVGPLADDPAVTDAAADALTTQVFQLLDVEQLAKEALPDKAGFLAAPLSTAVEGWVQQGSRQLLQTSQFKTFWDKGNRVVHENVVKILRGEPVAGFQASDGTVTFNFLPLISRALLLLQEKAPGLFDGRTVPVITEDTPPDQARQQLIDGLKLGSNVTSRLSPTFGVITVFQSDQLASAQQAIQLFDRVVWVIVLVTLALLVATIVLSVNRRRTLIGLGVGIALAMALANAIVNAIEKQIVGLVGSPSARDAAQVTISNLVAQLRAITNLLLWVGIIVVIVAFLTGQSRPALAIRRATVSFGHRLGLGSPAPGEIAEAPAIPWLAHHLNAFRIGGVAAAILGVILLDVTWGSLLLLLAVLAVYEVAVTILGNGGPGGGDDGTDGATSGAVDATAAGPVA